MCLSVGVGGRPGQRPRRPAVVCPRVCSRQLRAGSCHLTSRAPRISSLGLSARILRVACCSSSSLMHAHSLSSSHSHATPSGGGCGWPICGGGGGRRGSRRTAVCGREAKRCGGGGSRSREAPLWGWQPSSTASSRLRPPAASETCTQEPRCAPRRRLPRRNHRADPSATANHLAANRLTANRPGGARYLLGARGQRHAGRGGRCGHAQPRRSRLERGSLKRCHGKRRRRRTLPTGGEGRWRRRRVLLRVHSRRRPRVHAPPEVT